MSVSFASRPSIAVCGAVTWMAAVASSSGGGGQFASFAGGDDGGVMKTTPPKIHANKPIVRKDNPLIRPCLKNTTRRPISRADDGHIHGIFLPFGILDASFHAVTMPPMLSPDP